MKNTKTLFLSLISQITFISLSYIVLSEYIVRKYVIPVDFIFKSAELFHSSKTPNTIWGDSSTLNAISNLPEFKNFSVGSSNYRQVAMKIKKYYKNKYNKPKVIFQFALNGFAEYRNKKIPAIEAKIFEKKQYKPFLYMSLNYFQVRSYQYIKGFIKNGFKLETTEQEVFNPDGSTTAFGSDINKLLNQDLSIYLPVKNIYKTENFKAMEESIIYLKNKNADICFVSTPWHKKFRDKIDMKNFSNLRNFYKNYSEKIGYKYLDFTDYEYPSNYFYDPLHLNNKGAKEFTKLIEQRCFNN